MAARGLQRLDAQDHEMAARLQKLANPLHAGNICCAPGIEGSTLLEQTDDDNFTNTSIFCIIFIRP